MNIVPIADLATALPTALTTVGNGPATGAGSFGQLMQRFVNDTNAQQISADQSIERLATGQSDSIHEAMLELTKADLSLRLFMEVRNKLIDAYQEVMRMQL